MRTVVIPAGDKPSVVADAPEDYAKDTSPDKGAVACYLEDSSSQSPLKLLLVNCHLYGTNKYGVKEAVFDKVSDEVWFCKLFGRYARCAFALSGTKHSRQQLHSPLRCKSCRSCTFFL